MQQKACARRQSLCVQCSGGVTGALARSGTVTTHIIIIIFIVIIVFVVVDVVVVVIVHVASLFKLVVSPPLAFVNAQKVS
jgi:hypothetical protein